MFSFTRVELLLMLYYLQIDYRVVIQAGFRLSKAELLLLNRTQFSSLGIFISKKVENRKTKTTFIISVLKAVY